MKTRLLLLITTGSLFFAGCRKYDTVLPVQPAAEELSASIATEWMEQYRQIVKTQGLNPPQASRIYAYSAIALYEAVLPGMPGGRSLQGQVPLLTDLPKATEFPNMNYLVSANEAMYRVAKSVFPNLTAANSEALDNLYKKNNDALVKQVFTPNYQNSKDFGQLVGMAVIKRANADGFAETRTINYSVPPRSLNPAYWAPTGSATSPLEPYWGKIKCFAMVKADECEEPLTIAFSTTNGSAFHNEAMEVYNVSRNLTQSQKDIALWWADGGGTPTPPGHWLAIANKLATSKKLSLGKAAEMYALLNIGLADAFISCWDAKYKYNLLRPQTYIRDFVAGGSTWSSFIGTPPFPEYPSGHSVSSGTAAEILTTIFGTVAFTDDTNADMGMAPRSFNSFYQAADEAAMSRLYGGIHYRVGNENGVKQGKTLGKLVLKNIKLK